MLVQELVVLSIPPSVSSGILPLSVQVTPSVLTATLSVSFAINTNLPLPYTPLFQFADIGRSTSVQVTPFKLDAALYELLESCGSEMAINLLFPAIRSVIVAVNGSSTSVQSVPLSL